MSDAMGGWVPVIQPTSGWRPMEQITVPEEQVCEECGRPAEQVRDVSRMDSKLLCRVADVQFACADHRATIAPLEGS